MALLEEEIIERTAALVESLHALSGVLALALASRHPLPPARIIHRYVPAMSQALP